MSTHLHAIINRMDDWKGPYHSWFPTPMNAFNTTQDWWHSPVYRLSYAPVQSSRVVAHKLEQYHLYSTSLQPKKHVQKLFWLTTDDEPLPISSHPSFCTRQLKSEVKSTIDTFPPTGTMGWGSSFTVRMEFSSSNRVGRICSQPKQTRSCVSGAIILP